MQGESDARVGPTVALHAGRDEGAENKPFCAPLHVWFEDFRVDLKQSWSTDCHYRLPHPELAQWNPGERADRPEGPCVFTRRTPEAALVVVEGDALDQPGDFFGRRPTFRDCVTQGGDFVLLCTEYASGDPSKSRFCGVWAAQRG
jgi:hypothetical protein